MELKKDILVLNIVSKFYKVVIKITGLITKFYKILIKTAGLVDRTPLKMVNFHEQRVITPEGMGRYGPLSNLKKTLWYSTM